MSNNNKGWVKPSKFPIKKEEIAYHVHNYDYNPFTNEIFLFGRDEYILAGGEEGEPGVEWAMANRFIKNLSMAMRQNDKPILIHMKTCGGFWEEGMAIHNAIKACPNPVTILSYTHARSMSSLIFQAANKRVMMPDSYFMFHDGTVVISGTIKIARSNMEQTEKAGIRMSNIYTDAMRSNGSMKKSSRNKIKEYLQSKMDAKEDVFLSPDETLKLGLTDEIFGSTGSYDWPSLLDYTEEQLSR